MHVTIVGKPNSFGLKKDKEILCCLLEKNGITTDFRSVFEFIPLNKESDLSIHLEVVDERYFGKKNILIPNQEWFMRRWLKHLKKYDAIFCKSSYAFNIFKRYHTNVKYIGFTSLDYNLRKQKQLSCFHASGISRAKGTQFIADAWTSGLPELYLVSPHDLQIPVYNNIYFKNSILRENEYNSLRNKCLIHIYPSQVEGFGHCINEAKSCGAVVITVDYPPMNELISDLLIPLEKIFRIPGRLGEIVYANPKKIRDIIKGLVARNDLKEIGKKNRRSFLKNDTEFKERFMHEFKKL